jgi:uncharacterized membrane protein
MPVIFSVVALVTMPAALGQQYSFEVFQFPGASGTTPMAINNHGQIVGIVQGLGANQGFFKDGSVFSLISLPGAGPLNGTVANGINDNAQVVGSYTTENTVVISHGFVRTGQTITPFEVVGANNTQASDINNFGRIVGRFFATLALEIGRGFIKDGTNFTYFDAPGVQGPFGTFPYGINDSGQIVGQFADSTGFHSFLLDSNRFSLINVPQSSDTHVQGINISGQMAGYFSGPMADTHGFITIGGRFFQVDVPGVETTLSTSVMGINDSGQVVGSLSVSGIPGVFNLGFIATPCSGAGTNCINLTEIPQPDLAPRSPKVNVTLLGGGPPLGAEGLFLFFSTVSFSCI